MGVLCRIGGKRLTKQWLGVFFDPYETSIFHHRGVASSMPSSTVRPRHPLKSQGADLLQQLHPVTLAVKGSPWAMKKSTEKPWKIHGIHVGSNGKIIYNIYIYIHTYGLYGL